MQTCRAMRLERRSAAGPTRLLLIVALTVLATACVLRKAPRTSTQSGASADVTQLWVEPRDLETRDLFHGPGGAALAPDPSAPYSSLRSTTAVTARIRRSRPRGAQWSVKLGIEAQPEVVASRVLWAIGYHQPATYLLTNWQLTGKQVETPGVGRFRLESGGHKVIADWSWYENPFVSTQPFKGLLVANLILTTGTGRRRTTRSTTSQTARVRRRAFVVRDLGASLGKTTFPRFLEWTPVRGMGQGSRNDIAGFEKQALIKKVEGQRVTFDYRGIHNGLVDTLTVADVVWASSLMARISDRQWRDAFRARGTPTRSRSGYITKLKSKINEGLALAGRTSSRLETNRHRFVERRRSFPLASASSTRRRNPPLAAGTGTAS